MDTDKQSMSSSNGSSIEKIVAKEKVERDGWKGTLDFILTCVGFAVGLGNIWRFPYLCYKSGGGAFFVPYFIFLCLCGIPLFFLETVYGQFASLSPVAIWQMSPLFKGVGVGMVIVSALVCVYYNVIVAWTIYYLFMSLRATLPWSTCGNWWNDEYCVDTERSLSMAAENNTLLGNMTALSANITYVMTNSSTNITNFLIDRTKLVSSSEQFWERHVLQVTDGIENMGSLRWQLVLTLALAWIFVFFCLFQGVHVLGKFFQSHWEIDLQVRKCRFLRMARGVQYWFYPEKIMHFCAPFPYLVLLILLIRGLTLEGAMDGIKFYIIPRWEKLATFQVWGDAALQIFYSVGMAWGGIITMASYNDFKHNIYRDAMIVPIINCFTSIFAGLVIFSILGFMAHETGRSVEEVVKQGPGLTFVAYPEAVSMLPISPLWSVLFFFMLFIIGVDSQFGMFETCLSAFMDEFPHVLRKKRVLVAAVACFVEFLLGLPLVTEGGIYALQIIDWYCASFSLMLISLAECLAVSYVYGIDRFYKDIELMIGYKPSRFWSYMWRFVTPITIVFIWLFSIITLGPVTYGDKAYPQWAVNFGWCLAVVSIVPMPTVAIYKIWQEEGPIMERIKRLSKPTKAWGPREEVHRQAYLLSLEEDRNEAICTENSYTLPTVQKRIVKTTTTDPEGKSFLS